ncbi:MAG: magnesium transporter [Candidatus Omnitrophica bacterium]|nr:magnesium transporter [Candidatus Omnitrophota bacterium]
MTKTVKTYALFVPEIKQLLQAKDLTTLKSFLREINPVDLAEGWKEFSREEQLALFQVLPMRRAVVVFEELEVEEQTALLNALGDQGTNQMMSELPPGEVAHLFRKLPPRVTRRLTNLVKKQEAIERLEKVASYPPKTAGALMHTGVARLKESMTASQALEIVRTVSRSHVHEDQLLSTLYVTNGSGHLLGFVPLQNLVAAPHDAKVSELISSTRAIEVPVTANQEEAARLVAKYNLLSAPVVDEEGRLVGVLLVDDVLDILKQEASEDIAKMAGTRPEELKRRFARRIFVFRLPWLAVAILGQFIVSLVIKYFQGTLQEVVALASFFPLIAAMGGNVGAQSATVAVRGLATGELRQEDWLKTILIECRVGLMLGVTYGVVVGLFAHLLYGDMQGKIFSAVVSIGMVTSMTVAATLGSLGPFVLKRFGADPATATGPMITTITDVLSTSTYLILATLFLL